MVRTIVAVVLAAAAVVCGAEPTQKTCTLAGRIVSASSGEGIHRAVVTVRSQRTDRNMLSGPGGEFLFRGLEPGTYTLQAAAQGFAQRAYGERKSRPDGIPLTLKAGETVGSIELPLLAWGVIAGRVVDSDGDPVMGEKIVAARYVYDIGKHKRDLCTMAHAWTDDLGRFRIFALPPGRYYLRVSTHSMNGDPWRMQREAAASGRVAVPSFYPGTTDPAKAQAINIAAGEERADIEMTMLKLPVYCARGTVTSPEGKPASDVNVEMTMEMADNSRPTQSSRTNAEGRFEVCGLVAGSYIVQAWLPGIVGQGEAEVADQNVDGLVLRLGHPVKVSGTVVVAGRPGWVWRSPQIILDPIGTRGEPMGTAIRNGIFEFNHVLPGHYRAMTEVDGTYVQSVRFGGKLVTDTGAEIQAGVPPGSLDIVLGVASAEVSGVVRDANAQPVRGATVLLVPPPEFRDDNLRFRYAMSDNDGRYRLSSLPPGKYKLFALNDVDETIWRDPEFLKSIEGKGTAVSLMQDAKTSSDLTLIAVEESK